MRRLWFNCCLIVLLSTSVKLLKITTRIVLAVAEHGINGHNDMEIFYRFLPIPHCMIPGNSFNRVCAVRGCSRLLNVNYMSTDWLGIYNARIVFVQLLHCICVDIYTLLELCKVDTFFRSLPDTVDQGSWQVENHC